MKLIQRSEKRLTCVIRYRNVSMLFQQTEKIGLTVKEFIRLGDVGSNPSDERVRQAAEESGALPVIEKLPKVSRRLFPSLQSLY